MSRFGENAERVGPVLPNDGHGHRRPSDDLLRNASQQYSTHASSAVTAEDDVVHVLVFDEFFDGSGDPSDDVFRFDASVLRIGTFDSMFEYFFCELFLIFEYFVWMRVCSRGVSLVREWMIEVIRIDDGQQSNVRTLMLFESELEGTNSAIRSIGWNENMFDHVYDMGASIKNSYWSLFPRNGRSGSIPYYDG